MMQFSTRIPERAFGLDTDETVLGFQATGPEAALIPALEPEHAFDETFFAELKLWWEWEDTASPLIVTGPTGSGKTSGVLQFLARVNAPALELTCRARMDKSDLIGGFTPQEGGFRWTDGPALAAWRRGLTFVVNEFSLAPPEVWVSVNDLFEGSALYVEKTGEIVHRHPNTRVVITDNSGCGSECGYLAREALDTTTLDRCWHVRLGYLSEEEELALLSRHFPKMVDAKQRDVLAAGVRFARKSREVSRHPVSTRVLLRFLAILFKIAGNASGHDPLEEALSLALTAGLPSKEASLLQQIAHFEFASVA